MTGESGSSSEMSWRTALNCNGGACVEAGNGHGGPVVRDAAGREGPVLTFSAAAWREFTSRAKAGTLAP